MNFTCPFILASASPRRQTLLARLGVRFEVDPSNVDETVEEHAAPESTATRLALEKAWAVADRHPDALILGADTIVVIDGTILGKPASASEALVMLTCLSGRIHRVYTGISLVHPATGRALAECETTEVTFAPMTDREKLEYVATGSPLDKAGAYGIQDDEGAWFVSGIVGDFYNVVGLPLHRLYTLAHREFPDLIRS